MKRIDTANRYVDLFGAGKDGFKGGVPGVSDPTYLSADFMNGVQESIVRTIEAAGLDPSEDLDQLVQAISLLASPDKVDGIWFGGIAAKLSALATNLGASLIGTSIGTSIEAELARTWAAPRQIPRGAAKEEARSLSTGVNWVSNMRPTDPASVSGTGGFTNVGSFNGNDSDNFAAWELPFTAQSYVCQARLWWSGSNNNCFIGYNASAYAGEVDNSSFFSIGFAATGFVFNDKVALTVLVPAADLAVGFYSATMVYANGFFLVSIAPDGNTAAKTFTVNKTLAQPQNAQIGCYGTGDSIRDFRFCASSSSNPFSPPFGGQRAMSTPLSIPDTNPSGVQISVHLPAGYDPRITHRLAVYCHGSGGTDKDLWTYPNENTVLTALLNAGYVVMSAGYGQTAWGNPVSVSQNVAAIQYVIDRYNVFARPYIIGQSMGGMVGFNTVIVGGVTPAAFAGIYPASNLRYQYDHGFTAAIEGAYGFSGDANFDSATNGYDVLNDNPPLNFRGLAIKIWHSYGDTVVPRIPNSDALKTLAEQGGASVTIVTSTGDHGDASSFDGVGIVDFFANF
jgi:pimeloyl-ACP methyl ester carboxylesterase